MRDLVQQCATNERSIKEMLVQEEREKRIKELQSQFSAIPRDVIIQVLASVKWDVEEAIVPLFYKLEDYQRKNEEEFKKQDEIRQSQLPRPIEEKVFLKSH